MSTDFGDEDDAAILARCQSGDGAAWEVLVDRYQRLVYAIVLRTGMDEHMAADVFQIVFTRLLEHLPRLTQPDRLQAWIVTTTRREAQRQRQRDQLAVSMTDSHGDASYGAEWELADDSPGADETIEQLQQMNELRNAMDRLDDRCRTLLLLLSRDEDVKLTYDEVAQRLGVSVGSIGPTRSRCLDKLRRLVNG